MTDFGAFIELEPGVDALLHVSQISREHVEKPSDVLRIGQEIEMCIRDSLRRCRGRPAGICARIPGGIHVARCVRRYFLGRLILRRRQGLCWKKLIYPNE